MIQQTVETDNSPEPSNLSPLLKIKEAAALLNISVWTLRLWDNNGKLPAVRVGTRRDRRYRKKDILKIMNDGM